MQRRLEQWKDLSAPEYDFSKESPELYRRLKQKVLNAAAEQDLLPLEDEQLEYLNAAGTNVPHKRSEKPLP